MTVILSYKSGAALVMAGDLMVSSPTPLKHPIDLPTRFKTPVTNHHLVGLEQKTIIVNPHLAVAWAGNRMAARSIVLELAKLSKDNYSGPEVLKLITTSGLSRQELEEIGLIIWMINETPFQFTVQDYNVKEVIFNETSKIKFIGSGDYHFFEQIGFEQQRYDAGPNLSELDIAVGVIVQRIAIALFHELTCDVTHDLFYGGGFEVVVYDPAFASFRKIPLSFAVWGYDENEIWLSSPIFQQVYDPNGALFLRRFIAKNNIWHQTIFPIGNFITDVRSATFDPATPLLSATTIHYFVKKGSTTFSSLYWHDPGGSFAMTLDSNGQLITPFPKEFMDRFYKVTEESSQQP